MAAGSDRVRLSPVRLANSRIDAELTGCRCPLQGRGGRHVDAFRVGPDGTVRAWGGRKGPVECGVQARYRRGSMTDRERESLVEGPEQVAELFRDLLPAAVVDAIEWSTLALEPEAVVDAEGAHRETEVLFSVEIDGARALLCLFPGRESGGEDDGLLRLLVRGARILQRTYAAHPHEPLPVVLPVAIGRAADGTLALRSFHELFSLQPSGVRRATRFHRRFSSLMESLERLPDDETKAWGVAMFPSVALWAASSEGEVCVLLALYGLMVGGAARRAVDRRGRCELLEVLRAVVSASDVLVHRFPASSNDEETKEEILGKHAPMLVRVMRSRLEVSDPERLLAAATVGSLRQWVEHAVVMEVCRVVLLLVGRDREADPVRGHEAEQAV